MRRYTLYLLIIVLVSYGQMLGMGVWKDDNAIFFKFNHINEPAGFFGTGLLGQGPYRFSITPYWFIYKLVGYEHVWAYYLLILIFYFLITYLVYRVFSKLISPTGGKLAGFLFATGFVASEGFYWLANAMLADASMVIDLLVLLCYFIYLRKKRVLYYLLAIGLYWLVSFLVPLRNYYFFAVILLFELIYAGFKNLPRLIPFGLVFYRYVLVNLDARAFSLKDFFISLVGGNWYLTQGFLSSVASLVVPDWFTFWLFDHLDRQLITLGALLVIFIFYYLLFKGKRRGLIKITLFTLASILWVVISKTIYSTPVLILSPARLFIIRLGGLIALLTIALLLSLDKKLKGHFLFFTFWFVTSVAVYTFYEPTAYLGTTHRYFAHSLVALVGVLAVVFVALKPQEGFWPKLAKGMIIFWGISNLASSVIYQNKILKERSIPVSNFYWQLKQHVSEVEVGDVFYFDVAREVAPYYGDAFKVSSMPNETAIAWRYGVDRNDLKLFDKFEDFVAWVSENDLAQEQVHTFFYSKEGLVDTSEKTWKFLQGRDGFIDVELKTVQEDGLMVFSGEPIESITPIELELVARALPKTVSQISFPFGVVGNSVAEDPQLRLAAFDYQRQKQSLMAGASVTTNSVWFEDVADHLIDGDPNSVWRSHRIMWSKEHNANLTLNLGREELISGFVWFNAYSNNSPTKYSVEVSLDGQNWQQVDAKESQKRIEPADMQVISFGPQRVRYVRMIIFKSLSDDSPGIAEVWVVPAGFEKLDINQTESFLAQPFVLVPDNQSYIFTLEKVGYVGRADIYWQDNQSKEWVTAFGSKLEPVYDSFPRFYRVFVPARGTEIEKIKIANLTIPGEIKVTSVRYRHLPLKEILAK